MGSANPSRIALRVWLALGAALTAAEITLAFALPSGRGRTLLLGVCALLLLIACAAYGPRKWTFASRFGLSFANTPSAGSGTIGCSEASASSVVRAPHSGPRLVPS